MLYMRNRTSPPRRLNGPGHLALLAVGLWGVSLPAAIFWAQLRCPSMAVGYLQTGLRLRGSASSSPAVAEEEDGNAFDASALGSLTHLIVVCGHAVLRTPSKRRGGSGGWGLSEAGTRDDLWYLLPYQRGHDLPEAFSAHIRRGVELAAEDPGSLLVFSGGETRAAAGPRSEGASYWALAESQDWWGYSPAFVSSLSGAKGGDGGGSSSSSSSRSSSSSGSSGSGDGSHQSVRQRAVVEDFARDSLENLLFSIARFRQVTGRYPARFTVVGFDFKVREWY
jgi:hypothetical protein